MVVYYSCVQTLIVISWLINRFIQYILGLHMSQHRCNPLQVQMVIIARNLILPCVFSVAEFAEKLHPRTALKMMLVRCGLPLGIS